MYIYMYMYIYIYMFTYYVTGGILAPPRPPPKSEEDQDRPLKVRPFHQKSTCVTQLTAGIARNIHASASVGFADYC